MDDSCKCFVVIGLIVGGIGVLLLVILLPISFSGVEYYQYGFVRRKSTGSVSLDKVYTYGKYMIGPDYEFKTFDADAHFLDITDIRVYTFDKLEVNLDIYLQYFLRKEDLKILHEAYDLQYEGVIRKTATDAIKNTVPQFKIRDFIEKRKEIEAVLFETVQIAIGGKCCEEDCKAWKFACTRGCLASSSCNQQTDKGLWVDVKHFQMGEVGITDKVGERFLRVLVLDEENEEKKLEQQSNLVRKNTERMVRSIKNEAQEILEKAQAESKRIKLVSEANYTATVEKARSRGLKSLYSRLNINDQKVKNSFDYLRTLRGLDNIHLTVDFQQRIVGDFGGK